MLTDDSKLTTYKLRQALYKRYPEDDGEWVVIEEVVNYIGYGRQQRFIDLVAINCWPSKGLRIVTHEIKQDRADWIHELNDPEKRKFAYDNSTEAWFVAPAGVIKKGEVPEGWGLITVSDKLTWY